MRTKYNRRSKSDELKRGLYGYYGRFIVFESRSCGVSLLNLQAHTVDVGLAHGVRAVGIIHEFNVFNGSTRKN